MSNLANIILGAFAILILVAYIKIVYELIFKD